MSEKYTSTHIRLTVEQWERLRDEAHETRRSQSEIIREALEMRWKALNTEAPGPVVATAYIHTVSNEDTAEVTVVWDE